MGNTETKQADSKNLQRFTTNPAKPLTPFYPNTPAEEEEYLEEQNQENFFLQNPFTYKTPRQKWLDSLKENEEENERVADAFIAAEMERERLSPDLDVENRGMNEAMEEAEVLFRDGPTLGRGFGETAERRWQICGVALREGGVCGGHLGCEVHGVDDKRRVDRGDVGFDECLARWERKGEA